MMINLVLLLSSQDAACARALRTGLEARGYHVWRQPHATQVSSISHTIKGAVLSSAVVVLLWSESAASSADVAELVPLLLALKKTVLPLLLDQTELPHSLQHFPAFSVQQPWSSIAAQLVQQALLPPPDRDDPLIRLAALAGSNLLTERKDAVKQAELMLQHNDHRPEVRAILTYLAQHDGMIGVREAAQDALKADISRQQSLQSSPFLSALSIGNPNDMLGVRCRKCGHVTYFNKHRICKESRQVVRGYQEELKLECESCSAEMQIQVDCEGYK